MCACAKCVTTWLQRSLSVGTGRNWRKRSSLAGLLAQSALVSVSDSAQASFKSSESSLLPGHSPSLRWEYSYKHTTLQPEIINTHVLPYLKGNRSLWTRCVEAAVLNQGRQRSNPLKGPLAYWRTAGVRVSCSRSFFNLYRQTRNCDKPKGVCANNKENLHVEWLLVQQNS